MEPLKPKDPQQIGPYTLVGRLGSGGMGIVYLASRGSETVALKVIRDSLIDDPSEVTRFSREIQALIEIDSPYVARLIDSGVDDDRAWFATEYVHGPDLKSLVSDKGPLEEETWWQVARDLLDGLEAIHAAGVIHRDIKPANIILGATGAKIIDFGIANLTDATSVTSTGLVAGSPAWFSPEQLEGHPLTAATDLFSAGSVLVYAATGSSPWGDETTVTKASVFRILTAEPDLTALRPDQRAVVAELLRKNIAERRSTISRGAIARQASSNRLNTEPPADKANGDRDELSHTEVDPRVNPQTAPRSRRLIVGVVAILGVVLVSGVVVSGLTQRSDTPSPTVDSDYYNQQATWVDCPPSWFLEPDAQAESLSRGQLSCASVRVPSSHEAASGALEDFEIAMMRLSPDGRAQGTIFINPGGPGVSGVQQVQWSNFPKELLENFHIVGFDPRGVNLSGFADGGVVKCSDQSDFALYFEEGSPANEDEFVEVAEATSTYREQCARDNPGWWTLSTENVARDLDILRDAVTPGEPLNFIGSSYGTKIAGHYITLFPDNVGKVILDDPPSIPLTSDPVDAAVQSAVADEQVLRRLVEGYAQDQQIDFEEAWSHVLEMRQLADDGEIYGFAGTEPSPFEDAQVSSENLFTRGIQALYSLEEQEAQRYFNQGMTDLREYQWNGTFEWFALWLDGYDPDSLEGNGDQGRTLVRSNAFEILEIVRTMDFSMPPLSESQQREVSAGLAEQAPLSYALHLDSSGYEYFGPPRITTWYDLALEEARAPGPRSADFVPRNESESQILVVGSTSSYINDEAAARWFAEQLDATLVTVETSTNAPVGGYASECVNNIVVDYLLDRTTIADQTCSGR